ncbi:G-protein coupled receptors family 1 profile domain-containing protein [Caenorhabditis elegans]|uniref:G-protein coupled receptors family 1 profile domain-containing protein n=1 Tax=Caenorhabditis elegans TaxID=6239 RepID=G5EEU4_CAEEL|nr:G-protein coupled receptors family 1 profile domain-containing protein [Caenorhabditis elegans]CAA93674.3 G-protein coupled receptors family 1 profile domain-containing protein [Caenorhabditis elegans]|eukprot:NP_510555.2 Sex Peptide Receptor (Drosophila) Related [Caenorhabditis elegans]
MAIHHPMCYYNFTCRPVFIGIMVPVDWAVPMYGYMMPFIVTLTVATNSFIVVVLSHKYLRTPTNYVLLAMAVTELLTGLSCLPWFTYYYTLSGYKNDLQTGLPSFWCDMIPYMAAFLPSIFHTMAIWLTVYLAIQRYIYICVPSLVRKFCTIHRSKQVIFFIISVATIMYTPDLMAFHNKSHDVFDSKRNRTMKLCYRHRAPFMLKLGDDIYYKVMFTTQTVAVHLIPSVLLVIFTWKLVGAIRVADRRHANLLSKYSTTTRSTRRKFSELTNSSENENKITRLFKQRDSVSVGNEPRRAHGLKQNTRMLVVVILLFLITEIPAALIFTIHVLSVSLKFSFVDYQFLNILLIVRNVLIVVSYPFRFAIYCGMSQQFRDVVRQMFTGKMLTHAIRDKDNSTTMQLVQGVTDHSDDKRQSVVLCSANGTLVSSVPEERAKKDKAVQCNPDVFDEEIEVPFDPFLADLAIIVEGHDSPKRFKNSDSTFDCSTQCSTEMDNHMFIKRKSSLLRAALRKNQQLSAMMARVSS